MNGFEIEKTKEQKCSSKLVQDSTIIHKIFETYSSFHEKQCTPGKVNFYFSRIFLTLLTSNNRASFHFWAKQNLVKHKKVSEYCSSGLVNVFSVLASTEGLALTFNCFLAFFGVSAVCKLCIFHT